MMIELATWMRRGESLGMGRSLSANRFMYWEPSKDISPDSVILLIFLKVGNSGGFSLWTGERILRYSKGMLICGSFQVHRQHCTQVLNAPSL